MVLFIQDLFDFHKVPLFPGVIAPGTQSAAIDIHYFARCIGISTKTTKENQTNYLLSASRTDSAGYSAKL
jgi:hypothetical protein